MVSERVVLALNGKLMGSKEDYRGILSDQGYFFVAADGGALFLERIGFRPDIVIGDLDSLTEEDILRFRKMEVEIYKYPVEKDETDGELALKYCKDNGLQDIVIIGSMGGRFDQQLANVFLLEYAYHSKLKAIIKEPGLELGIIDQEKVFINQKGAHLSLLPLKDKVEGVSISGCKYGLVQASLLRYKTRGISNLIISNQASVSIEKGLLLYFLM
jgi:thiamine pyrophosphokinase